MNKNNIKAEVSDTWLRAFVAATRSGSFSAAAHALGVGQSAVTHSVARLENALGIRLFIRTPSGIVPTAAGANLFERISQLFVDIDRAVELARPNQGDPTVTLSVSTSLATYWLMPRLVEYKRDHPHVHLRVTSCETCLTHPNAERSRAPAQGASLRALRRRRPPNFATASRWS